MSQAPKPAASTSGSRIHSTRSEDASLTSNPRGSLPPLTSGFLLEDQDGRDQRRGEHDVHQLPSQLSLPAQFGLHVVHLEAPHQPGLDLDGLVTPALAHALFSCEVDGVAFGRRPALRSASRSTYSICALTLRSSSSAQRCTAARMSALIRSG